MTNSQNGGDMVLTELKTACDLFNISDAISEKAYSLLYHHSDYLKNIIREEFIKSDVKYAKTFPEANCNVVLSSRKASWDNLVVECEWYTPQKYLFSSYQKMHAMVYMTRECDSVKSFSVWRDYD